MSRYIAPLRALPLDEWWDADATPVKSVEAYNYREDPAYNEYQKMFIAAIKLAVEDCYTVLNKDATKMPSCSEVINATSAARFLLSKEGAAFMKVCGDDGEVTNKNRALAKKTLASLGIRPEDVFRNSQDAWRESVGGNGKGWTKNFNRSKVMTQTLQGTFRPLLMAA